MTESQANTSVWGSLKLAPIIRSQSSARRAFSDLSQTHCTSSSCCTFYKRGSARGYLLSLILHFFTRLRRPSRAYSVAARWCSPQTTGPVLLVLPGKDEFPLGLAPQKPDIVLVTPRRELQSPDDRSRLAERRGTKSLRSSWRCLPASFLLRFQTKACDSLGYFGHHLHALLMWLIRTRLNALSTQTTRRSKIKLRTAECQKRTPLSE